MENENKQIEISKETKLKFYRTMIEDLEQAMLDAQSLQEYERLIDVKSILMSKLWDIENED